jgi:streptogramin lyase
MIPNAPSAGSTKRRAFVSSSASGALVTTYAHSDTTHSTPLGSSASNISATSSACTTVSGGRTCTITITAPAGDDDFVFGLYDAPPVNGAIPSTAHELGVAGVTQTIAAGTTNTIIAPISAIIAGFSGSTTNLSEAADGNTHTVALVISPTDFGNNTITAGSANAPYANPITATVGDGSKGYTQLSLNGGAPATSVTLTKVTDTVQAVYNGDGTSSYTATVNLSAPALNGQGGATTESLTLTPVLFITNPTVFAAGNLSSSPATPAPAQLDTYPEGQHVLLISEPSAASGTTYTATPTGCAGILSVGTVVGKGTNATLLVVGGTTTSTSGCSLAISDGTTTFTAAVSNTIRPAPASSPQMTEYTIAANSPGGIVTGGDGNLWFTEAGSPPASGSGQAISSIKSDGTGYTPHLLGSYGFTQPVGDALGPDGNVWFGDYCSNLVGKITPAGTIAAPYSSQTYAGAVALTAGLDGNIWFTENGFGSGMVAGGNINTTTGALNEVSITNMGGPFGVALGPDGNAWFSECLGHVIGHITGGSGGTATAFNGASQTTTYQPTNMTAGSDGALWFVENLAIGRITTGGTLSQTAIPGASPQAVFITAGPDGALWFTDTGNNAIGRITTSGTITEYTVTTPFSNPTGITVGPDGNIWFTECLTNTIGMLKL